MTGIGAEVYDHLNNHKMNLHTSKSTLQKESHKESS